MNPGASALKERLADVVEAWRKSGMPTRYELEAEAQALLEWKRACEVPGLWERPPVMVTATLDDGLGYGIEIIRLFAEVAGVKVISLGLGRAPEEIISECRRLAPDILGLTVLQLSSEDSLKQIGDGIPEGTRLIVGGSSIFRADPDLPVRCGVDYVAENVGAFVDYLLRFESC